MTDLDRVPRAGGPTTAEVRAWARGRGLPVTDRDRLRPEILAAGHTVHGDEPEDPVTGPEDPVAGQG